MQTIRIKHGRTSAIVRGPDAAELEAMVRRAMGPAVELLERARDEVWAIHKLTWPIFTGASVASFEPVLVVDTNRHRIEALMRTDEPAVRYTKSTKHGKERNATRLRYPLQELRRDMATAGREIAPELRDAIQRALTDEVRRG